MSQNKINDQKPVESVQQPVEVSTPENKVETQNDVVKAEKQTEKQLKQQERVWLTINSTANDSSKVTVGVNGYAYRINRDEPALVPKAVVEVLKLASEDQAYTNRQENGQIKVGFKNVRRFSFTVEPMDAHPLPK